MTLALLVGGAALVLITVVIIAVLKASSDYDDMTDLIQYQTKKGLEERDGHERETNIDHRRRNEASK